MLNKTKFKIFIFLFLVVFFVMIPIYAKEKSSFVEVKKVKYDQDILYTFKHKKLGMEVIWIKNKDKRKSFALGVKTPTSDNTGVNHIIEHTVLTGSKKYPFNNLFFDAGEAYPSIYMNAFTSADLTVYPFCTPYDTCYENLMHIYLDSVLNPTMIDQPHGFYQESFHYNPRTNSFGGVVYNEMKGAIKAKDRIIYRSIRSNIYKGTHYENDSGGLPSDIPKLTYEEFINVYKKYYHPSNMKIVLYGDIQIEKMLNIIDNYINKYTSNGKEENMVVLPKQPPTHIVDSYISDSDKSLIIKSYLVRKKLSIKEQVELDLWVHTYLINPNSYFQTQIKKMNIERVEVCKDSDLPYPIYSIVIKDVEQTKKELYKRQLIDLLEDIKTKDIRNVNLEQDTISQYNVAQKIGNSDPLRGIDVARSIFEAWAHEKDTYQYYVSKDYIHKLKEINPVNKELLLSDSQQTVIELSPKEKLIEEDPKEISSIPKEKWEDVIASLSEWQNEKNKATFEKINEEELVVSPEAYTNIKEEKEVYYMITPIHTKLAQIQLYYNTTGVEQNDLPYLALYSYLLNESAKEMTPYKASFSIAPIAIEKNKTYTPYLKISILTDTTIKDRDTLLDNVRKELIAKETTWYLNKLNQFISEFEEQQNENILQNLICISSGSIKGASRYNYEMTYPVYELCSKLKEKQDTKWIDKVKNIDDQIYHNQGLKVGIACPKNVLYKYKKSIQKIIKHQESKSNSEGAEGTVNEKRTESNLKETVNKNIYDFKLMPKVNVYLMDTNVDYIYMSFEKDKPVDGIDYIASSYLTKSYISPQIRLKNGAYGAGMNPSSLNAIGLYTYRDPDYIRSLQVFDNIGDQLKKIDKNDLEGAKKEALSRVQNAFKLFANDMVQADAIEKNILGNKIDIIDLQNQIVSTTVQDVEDRSDEYAQIPKRGILSIATSKNKRVLFINKKVYSAK